jgi:hypothetical protein
MTQDMVEEHAGQPPRRDRKVLAGVALVLACVSILISTVAVWTHQVALNTDRFTALVSDILEDPAVIEPLADRISTQVVTALDVEGRIAARLPELAQPLAAPITLAIRDGIDNRLQVALARPVVQDGLVAIVSFTHARIMNLLRDKPEAVTVVDGYIVVSAFPVVEAALEELQAIGLLPADVQIPDLSAPEAPEMLAQRLENAFGIMLPEGFGTIQLMKADKLLAARSAVQAFDFIVLALLILTAILIGLTLWLASDRLRMVIYLGLGTIIAFVLARLAIGAIENFLLDGVADGDLAEALRAVADATLADLRGLTAIVLLATVVLVVLALLSIWRARGGGRLEDLSIERIGLLAIGFVVIWLAIGPDVALLAAALIIGLELIVRARTSRSEVVAPAHEG